MRLRTLHEDAESLRQQFGLAAARQYITDELGRIQNDLLLRSAARPQTKLNCSIDELRHLLAFFEGMWAPDEKLPPFLQSSTSSKVLALLSLLEQEASPMTRGVVFVESKLHAIFLHHLLRRQITLAKSYKVVMCIDDVQNIGIEKRRVRETVEKRAGRGGDAERDLERFRDGNANLMITTSNCTKDVEISACNLVCHPRRGLCA